MELLSVIPVVCLLWYTLFIIPTKWLKVEKINVPLKIGKKLLHISDLHVERLRVTPETIKKVIVNEKIDYIFLTGDLLHRDESIDKLKKYLQVFKESNIDTYMVMGNHDYEVIDLHYYLGILKEYNINVLFNEWVEVEDFVIVGIDDYATGHEDVEKSYENLETDKKIITLCHDPNLYEFFDKKTNLFLSGHLHGKQINIPFFFKLKPMGPLTEKNIYKGLNLYRGSYLYISKGVGQMRWNVRFAVRSELSIITI